MRKILKKTSVITRVSLLLTLVALFAGGSSLVRADTYDTKINSINAKNAQNEEALGSLDSQANSYQAAINELQARINALQRSINQNQAQQTQLQKQIEAKRVEIARQRGVLGEVLRSMYVDGDISTIEMLATSNNLSDYVDKEEYRNSVQNQIQDTLAQIAVLQKQLQAQKVRVDQLISDQKSQQSQLAADRQKQSSMLSYNQQQQDAFTSKIKQNNALVAKLRAEQAAAQAAYARRNGVKYYGVAGNGGYPSRWANAQQDTIVDDWGMLNRECVSYVAWKVASTGRYMPHWGGDYTNHYGGNAHKWVKNADIDRIPHGQEPRRHSVAMWDGGDGVGSVGHVAYVEEVNSDGSIEVSQYNFGSGLHGKFSRMHVPAGDARQLDYIYF